MSVRLTLHYPKGTKGVPIATTTDSDVLHYFKQVVLEEWEDKIDSAGDESEAMLHSLEYQRLRAALSVFIPDVEDETQNPRD
jgi:hypothetical protein